MQEWLIQFVSHHEYLVYAVLVIFACIEGPILSVFAGILVRAGTLHFLPAYIALMAGDLAGDALWYAAGRHFGTRLVGKFGKYFGITQERVERVSGIFHRHKEKILVISKMTNGLGFALVTLVAAGIAKIPFGSYMFYNFIGQFVWSGLLIGLGFSFAHAYSAVNSVLEKATVTALFVLVALALFGLVRYFQTKSQSKL